jgi:hypothetical protein
VKSERSRHCWQRLWQGIQQHANMPTTTSVFMYKCAWHLSQNLVSALCRYICIQYLKIRLSFTTLQWSKNKTKRRNSNPKNSLHPQTRFKSAQEKKFRKVFFPTRLVRHCVIASQDGSVVKVVVIVRTEVFFSHRSTSVFFGFTQYYFLVANVTILGSS